MIVQKHFKLLLLTGACIWAQTRETAPIFRATVIERTTKAINYRYRAEPTPINFVGTVLMPQARGSARVTSKQGRTEIEASFERLTPPTPFGREYLTYVLWSLSPDGRPQNLGEIITNGRDKAKVRVSTDLQAFALVVTAEPYASVRRPSDVVVMENRVRPDTLGMIGQVNARYELLPRGHYVLERFDDASTRPPDGPRVSAREYEVQLQLYEAQNAVNIARTAARASEFAPEVLTRAESLLQQARSTYEAKGDRTRILQLAREATHTAEDARLVALERFQRNRESSLKAELQVNRQAQINAESDAAKARAERQAAQAQLEHTQAAMQTAQLQAQAQLEAERARRIRAEAELRAIEEQRGAARGQARELEVRRAEQKSLRARLYAELNATMRSLDTPRGLVVIVGDDAFNGSKLRPETLARARRIATILSPYAARLGVTVEGHSDSPASEIEAGYRAQEIAASLSGAGIPASAQLIGDKRRLGASALENRRVEILIQGDPIGPVAVWDRSYTISSKK